MLRPTLALLSAASLAAMAVTGCGVRIDDGPTVTEPRDVPASVVVTGGEDTVRDLTTEVRDGVLHIDHDSDDTLILDGRSLKVAVVMPALTGVRTEGSGDVDADLGSETVARLELAIEGSGDIAARGRAETLTATSDGSGDFDLSGLSVTRATVALDGSGDAQIDATDTLDVTIDGSGDVTYVGDPLVAFDRSGSGDLKRR